MDTTQNTIQTHLTALVDRIGPRMGGTPADRAAAEYISAQFEKLGLEVEWQPFTCPDWSCSRVDLTRAGKSLKALVNPFSTPCDITGIPAAVCTLAELESAEFTGRPVILYGELSRTVLAAKSWFLIDDRDKRIIQLLEEKKPAAVMMVQANPVSILRMIEDWEFLIPSVTLPAETARVLLRDLSVPIHLKIESVIKPGQSANLVVRLHGSRPEWITLMAHFDTKIDTPGACDNAAGVASVLALAEYFGTHRPEVGLEFIAFANEEVLPIGDDEYLRRVGESHLQDILLGINFDGLGNILDGTTVAVYTASNGLCDLVKQVNSQLPAVQAVDPWPESNHSTFSWRGVPCLAFGGQGYHVFAHQLIDTTDWMSPAKIAEAVDFARRVIETVQNKPAAWLRPEESGK